MSLAWGGGAKPTSETIKLAVNIHGCLVFFAMTQMVGLIEE
jgi:hypothetical protein